MKQYICRDYNDLNMFLCNIKIDLLFKSEAKDEGKTQLNSLQDVHIACELFIYNEFIYL